MITKPVDGKEYILSLSYGKDSLACLGALDELNMPLSRIVHVEVWATDNIPAELPEMINFKKNADKLIEDKYKIKVEHIYCKKFYDIKKDKITYEDGFYYKAKRGKFVGNIKGFPMCISNWCNKLKVDALKQIDEICKNNIQYIGIAYDEPKRFNKLDDKHISPLVKIRWTEEDCMNWCKKII